MPRQFKQLKIIQGRHTAVQKCTGLLHGNSLICLHLCKEDLQKNIGKGNRGRGPSDVVICGIHPEKHLERSPNLWILITVNASSRVLRALECSAEEQQNKSHVLNINLDFKSR